MFHDTLDQDKYRANPIVGGKITFFDSKGNEVLTDFFRISSKDIATDLTAEREYQVKTRAAEKFRDALYRLLKS